MSKKIYPLGLMLSVLAVAIAIVETIKYPGFIVKHTGFNVLVLYIITGIVIRYFPPPNPHKQLISRAFRTISLASISIAGILLIIETITYPNYVFSTIHIHLDGLQILTVLFFIYFVLTNLRHDNLKLLLETTLLFAVISVLFNYTLANIINTRKLVIKEIDLIQASGPSYSDKQRAGWGDIYTYTELLRKSTPENAIIAIPPAQNHWLYSGNLVLMRYFLYPRTLVNVKESDSIETLYDLPDVDYDYVAIIWGESNTRDSADYGWPKAAIPSEYIEYFNLQDGSTRKVIIDSYMPEDHDDESIGWGLIKVQRTSQ